MEGLQNFVRYVSKEIQSITSSPSSSEKSYDLGGKLGPATATLSSSTANHSRVLAVRPPSRNMVSAWTCSKLCLLFFAAGIVTGYRFKRRVRIWASRLLKRLKDD
ncbi:unnamed protein product [Linum tenue]|uniref:Transmembrane protein n=1 Tax=Linum tenue TaxID=586396 RepID=A0AAV0HRU9_9ROSI|nr:unnamed protein product [Linum tenue]